MEKGRYKAFIFGKVLWNLSELYMEMPWPGSLRLMIKMVSACITGRFTGICIVI